MTESKANEILRTKYPEGTIYNGKRFGGASSSEMVVTFSPNGRCYHYYATSYQQVLEKLGFKILYKHNVTSYNNRIKELESNIAAGGYDNSFFAVIADEPDFVKYTQEEITAMKAEIDNIKKELSISIIC